MQLKYFLGATMSELNNSDLNELFKAGFYYTNGRDTVANKPAENLFNNTIWVLKNPISERTTQIFFCINEKRTFIRYKDDLGWGNWEEISTDIPLFYKNYADLSSLANALGALATSHYIGERETYNFGNGWWGLIRITIVNTTSYETPSFLIISNATVTWLYKGWYLYSENDVQVDVESGNLTIYNGGGGQTFYLTKIG